MDLQRHYLHCKAENPLVLATESWTGVSRLARLWFCTRIDTDVINPSTSDLTQGHVEDEDVHICKDVEIRELSVIRVGAGVDVLEQLSGADYVVTSQRSPRLTFPTRLPRPGLRLRDDRPPRPRRLTGGGGEGGGGGGVEGGSGGVGRLLIGSVLFV
ncbi:unnamed protein product [Pleuronectes platessa]|uniref:Uncharacterized protein n=1 Tax=Pleuronectes platessa TaxID=8262 RepID=A0A9N7VW34_PLEPL|nr:unnamed protein product [Pleuronectes platessa]